jgi:hypothetical protein
MSQIFTVEGQGTIVVKHIVKIGKIFTSGTDFIFFVDLCNSTCSTAFAFETKELAEHHRNILIDLITKE